MLILTTFDLDERVYDALRAGASGFLLKDIPPDQLAGGVRMVGGGDALLAPGITRRLIEEFAQSRTPPSTTVKTHITRILTKLSVRDRVQAVVLAYETGLVTPKARGGSTQAGDRR